jgi:hypothetical protein
MCDCINRFNEHLAVTNTQIELPMWTASGQITPFVVTIKIDQKKRGKPTSVFASHCPFCGVKYPSKDNEGVVA